MPERHFTETNSGGDSKPVVWIFEGNNVLWMVAGLGAGLMVFRLAHGAWQWSLVEAMIVALVPVLAATLYVLVLKAGKPPSYDKEWFEWMAIRAQLWVNHRLGVARHQAPFGSHVKVRNRHPLNDLRSDDAENS